jgi:hypothetical protein
MAAVAVPRANGNQAGLSAVVPVQGLAISNGEGKRPIPERVRASDLGRLSDGERVEAVNALKNKAYAQIKSILAERQRLNI